MKKNRFFKKMFRIFPHKKIYIEGNAEQELKAEEAEILEGEATPVRVYFNDACEYEIVEREITPAKINCPGCKRTVLSGMDYCNFCGCHIAKETTE